MRLLFATINVLALAGCAEELSIDQRSAAISSDEISSASEPADTVDASTVVVEWPVPEDQYPETFFNTSYELIDAFDLDPYTYNRDEDNAYLDYYLGDDVQLFQDVCQATSGTDLEYCSWEEPMKSPPKYADAKKYCQLRPHILHMIQELEKAKDNEWYQAARGVDFIAGKIAAIFGIGTEFALPIAEYLVGMGDALKTRDDLIKFLKEWSSAMGRDVCHPLNPDNSQDPDLGGRTVGMWSACTLFLNQPEKNRVPKYCNAGDIATDMREQLAKDCDTECHANGGINTTNGLSLEACKKRCVKSAKALCKVFGPGKTRKDESSENYWKRVWKDLSNLCAKFPPDGPLPPPTTKP
jgi:hypothetical protein